MSKPTEEQIKEMLTELRKFIDETDCETASRVAYEIETAVRFVTEDTDWGQADEGMYDFISASMDAAELIKA